MEYKKVIYVILLPVDLFDNGREIIERNNFNLLMAEKIYSRENEFHLKKDYIKHLQEFIHPNIQNNHIFYIGDFQDMYNDEMVVGSDTWFGYGIVEYMYED